MKTALYKLVSQLGYKIENKKKEQKRREKAVSKYNAQKNIPLLVKSFAFVQNIAQKYQDLQITDYKEGVLMAFDGLKIYVESYEELFILDEVFVQNDYRFLSNEKMVVIDIGANIGTSCLFFSKMDNVEKIYAYEPVPDTFEQAKLNLELNKEISKVTKLNNFGLGKSNRDEVFLFDRNVKGNTGVRGAMSSSFKADNVVETKVMIKNAAEQIDAVITANPNSKIIVKMDCEGGEYEIFESLSESGVITKIDYLMMEWHDKGAEVLEEVLLKNGFMCFSQRLAVNSGMIYAVKK
jgi:FkbM family methyltransferase